MNRENTLAGATHHVFITMPGRALPRWLEAFPRATVVSPDSVSRLALPPSSLVWLRLQSEQPATAQVNTVRAAIGATPLVVLSNQPSEDEALAAFSVGARGYCNAHATAANLSQVSRVVLDGGLWIGESLMHRLLTATRVAAAQTALPLPPGIDDIGSKAEIAASLAALTEREQEVAHAVADGASNKEIARQLDITERTVKAHVGSIFQKLNVRDRLHLSLILNGQRARIGKTENEPSELRQISS